MQRRLEIEMGIKVSIIHRIFTYVHYNVHMAGVVWVYELVADLAEWKTEV